MRNFISLTSSEVENLKLVKHGDQGLQAKVYRLNEEECIKIFPEEFNPNTLDKIIDYTKYCFPCAVLPRMIVSIDGKYKAYTMEYINGSMLANLDETVSYRWMLEKTKQLLVQVKNLSWEGFRISDCHTENIMLNFNTDSLTLIDTENWSKKNYNSTLFEKNFKEIDNVVREYIFGSENLWLFNFEKRIDSCTDYIDFYESFIQKYISKEKIKTLEDIRNCLH